MTLGKWWRWVLALVVVVLTVGSGFAALRARTPGEVAARSEPPPASTITVPVESQRLARTVTLDCSLVARYSVAIQPVTGDGSSAAVISAVPRRDGEKVVEGDVVVEVSARPVIVLQGKLPSFRDLRPGMQGSDVRQLQKALQRLGFLNGAADGTFASSTSSALIDFYRSKGYVAELTSPDAPVLLREARQKVADAESAVAGLSANQPRKAATEALTAARQELADLSTLEGAVLPVEEVAFIASRSARISSPELKLGGVLQADQVSLTSGRKILSCNALDAAGFPKDAVATVITPAGETVKGQVQEGSSSAPSAAESGPDDLQGGADTGQAAQPTVLISTRKALKTSDGQDGFTATIDVERAEETGLVVPVTALWSRPGGETIVKVSAAGAITEVPVTVVMEADGLVQVQAPAEQLRQGDEVVVSDASGRGGQ